MAIKARPQDLNKQFILDRISEEELWNKYFTVDFNRNFKSPLRNDHRETCWLFQRENGSWWMKDGNGSFCGSVFDALIAHTRLDFHSVLEKIVKELNLYGSTRIISNSDRSSNLLVKQKRVIRIKSREWEEYDIKYWESHGVTRKEADFFHIIPVSHVFMNNKVTGDLEIVIASHPNNPVYAYRMDVGAFKIYIPKGGDFRFICNTDIWNGWRQLPATGDLVVIQKSLKDIALLKRLGIPATGPQGEGFDLPEDKILDLKKRFKRVLIWYDQDWDKEDNVGQRNAKKHADKYQLENIAIPIEYKLKDPTDFCKYSGFEKTEKLINTLLSPNL
jgi:hypothetical protein